MAKTGRPSVTVEFDLDAMEGFRVRGPAVHAIVYSCSFSLS